VKYVLFKPGRLATEYMKGRRASFLNPVRMYVFTSFIFFLIFFAFSKRDIGKVSYNIGSVNDKRIEEINAMDSASFAAFTSKVNEIDNKPGPPMSRQEFQHFVDSLTNRGGIHFTQHYYKSKEEYDSMLATGAKKHNWLQRQLIYKEIEMNKRYDNNSTKIISAFQSNFIHHLPQMMFVSLPFLALLLKFLYVRRKEYYYVNHAIFTIYLFIFIFIIFLVMIGFARLYDWSHWGIFKGLLSMLTLSIFVYEYAAMYNFYRQNVFVTFAKFLLFNILVSITIGVVFICFLLFSLYEI
jgi:hypothetical protein